MNAFLPLIADCLLESLQLLSKGVDVFRRKCVDTLKANEERCQMHLKNSMTLITALVPYLGYEKAEEIFQKAEGNPEMIRELLRKEQILTGEEIEKVMDMKQEITYNVTRK